MGVVSRRRLMSALAIGCGVAAVGAAVTIATESVDRSGAAFTDAATGELSLETGRVSITPDAPTSLAFSGRIGPGATAQQTITIASGSTVELPAACVVLDVLPVRRTSPNAFSEALASVVDVTVERKAGSAGAPGSWSAVSTGTLGALAPTPAPAFGAGLEAGTTNGATSQNGATVRNGESVTYRFTFSMAASIENTVTFGGEPVDITAAFADAEFRFVAQNVTAGNCSDAVSAA